MEHLVVAARHYDYYLAVAVYPDMDDADWLASLRIGGIVTPGRTDHELFEVIPFRRTTRAKFEDRKLPDELSERCLELRCCCERTLLSDVRKNFALGILRFE